MLLMLKRVWGVVYAVHIVDQVLGSEAAAAAAAVAAGSGRSGRRQQNAAAGGSRGRARKLAGQLA